ncbi:glycosyltransferase family 4 protein [Arthrobacter sp. KFRI-F3372]|uniref:glycosyltransferase family 4 protein n=1 Tax=Pseudarthrobacter oxydans TaxID=1671 RepID=UPI0027A321FD|nr:glycosyltransferase family 4 protein [Arthrobacter sp. KFRI-F3372]
MRVLRIFHGGGVPAYQRRDEEISALGHEVQLVVPKTFRELPTLTIAQERDDVIRVTPVALYGLRRNPFFFYNPFQIASIIRAFNPNVVDLHEEPYSLAAASVLLGRLISGRKNRFVFRSSQNEFKSYPFPFSAVQRLTFKQSSEAYVPSEQARRVLQQKEFPGRVTVVGNGVTVPASALPVPCSSNTLEVVCVGRLIERKGVQDLVEAVVGSEMDMNLTIVGSGPMEDQLRDIAQQSNACGNKVTFTGALSIDQAAEIMRRSDVICVPSRELDGWSEQFSRALVEGMANYCVPVVSSSGALPEIAGDIVDNFRWGDVEDLRARLEELVDAPNIENLKLLAHKHAARNYSWQATSGQISAIYERVV